MTTARQRQQERRKKRQDKTSKQRKKVTQSQKRDQRKKDRAKKAKQRTKTTVKAVEPSIKFLYGPIQSPQSSWVSSFAFVYVGRGKNGMGVAVQFVDGFQCYYPGTEVSDYQYLRKAASKGKSIWRRFYWLEYQEL